MTQSYRDYGWGEAVVESHDYLLPVVESMLSARKDRTILDVGCGNGEYLRIARGCGYRAVGLEPDPAAVALCRAMNLEVHAAGINFFDSHSEIFDVITLSHVIEHVHQPCSLLSACYRLLRPGGFLWMETPNMLSFGHFWFRRDWRGLEVPRHLVIFSRNTLHNTLSSIGFRDIEDRPRPSRALSMFTASAAMKESRPVNSPNLATPWSARLLAVLAATLGAFLPTRREFINLTARK